MRNPFSEIISDDEYAEYKRIGGKISAFENLSKEEHEKYNDVDSKIMNSHFSKVQKALDEKEFKNPYPGTISDEAYTEFMILRPKALNFYFAKFQRENETYKKRFYKGVANHIDYEWLSDWIKKLKMWTDGNLSFISNWFCTVNDHYIEYEQIIKTNGEVTELKNIIKINGDNDITYTTTSNP